MKSAPPIGPPGCPDLAFSGIATDRTRMLLAMRCRIALSMARRSSIEFGDRAMSILDIPAGGSSSCSGPGRQRETPCLPDLEMQGFASGDGRPLPECPVGEL